MLMTLNAILFPSIDLKDTRKRNEEFHLLMIDQLIIIHLCIEKETFQLQLLECP